MTTGERRAEVVWEGDLTHGNGRLSAGSGALSELPVTWVSRVERPDGKTSPEELIAGAHAACYAMALSHTLAEAGHPPERLTVNAVCALELDERGLRITSIDLSVRGRVPGIDQAEFEQLAQEGERNCPVSNALRNNLEIRLTAALHQ